MIKYFSFAVFVGSVCSIDFIADLPNSIRHNVDEFSEISVFGATQGQHISVFVRISSEDANALTLFNAEAQHLFDDSFYTFSIPFRINPSFATCHSQNSSATDDTLCSATVTMLAKEGGTTLWNGNAKIAVVKTPAKIYIQTNKPSYFLGEQVQVRFVALTHDFISPKKKAQLKIERTEAGEGTMVLWQKTVVFPRQPYVAKVRLPESNSAVGTWKISALFSSKTMTATRSEITFNVGHTTLPSFKVTLSYKRNFILPHDEYFTMKASARTFRDVPIHGNAHLSFGLTQPDLDDYFEVTHFKTNLDLVDGDCFLNVSINQLTSGKDPLTLERMHLAVIASVDEYGSGETETIRDETVVFSDQPFSMTFIGGRDEFVPGEIMITNVKLKHLNSSFAVGVQIHFRFTYVNGTGQQRIFYESTVETCHLGTAMVRVESPASSKRIEVIASGVYSNYAGIPYNFSRMKVFLAKASSSNEYISIVPPREILPLDSTFVVQIYAKQSVEEKKIHYHLSKNGKKLQDGTVGMPAGKSDILIELSITSKMSPSILLTAYYYSSDSNELVVDRSTLFVEEGCRGAVPDIHANLRDGRLPKPGQQISFEVTGKPMSVVSIVAVDKAVKAMNAGENNIGAGISPDFFKLRKQSLSAETYRQFFGTFSRSGDAASKQPGLSRQKRGIANLLGERMNVALGSQFNGEALECCIVGARNISSVYHNAAASCEDRKGFLQAGDSCKRSFLDCCKLAECFRHSGQDLSLCRSQDDDQLRSVSTSYMAFPSQMKATFLLEKNLELQRKDFSATWIFMDAALKQNREITLNSSSTPPVSPLPDRITSWDIDVFSTSANTPICFGVPTTLTVYHAAYTVVTVPEAPVIVGTLSSAEIVIYNHLEFQLQATLHIEAGDGICGGDSFGKTSHTLRSSRQHGSQRRIPTTKKILLSFIPIQAGEFRLKVKLLWRALDGGRENVDEVVKKIRVIPEGTLTKEFCWIFEDTRGEVAPGNVKEKPLPISDDAIPGTVEITASVYSVAKAFLIGPDTDKIPSTTIQYHLYRLYQNLLKLEYFDSTGRARPPDAASLLEELQESYDGLLSYVKRVDKFATVKDLSTRYRGQMGFSYSPTSNSPPSLKLTSSVLAILYRLSRKLEIDEVILRGCLVWVLNHQSSTGYFKKEKPRKTTRQSSKIKSRESKITTMSKTESKVYITSGIIVDLVSITTTISSTSTIQSYLERVKSSRTVKSNLRDAQKAIARARAYLKKKAKKVASGSKCRSSAALALAAHALELSDGITHQAVSEALERWKISESTDAGAMWWIKTCVVNSVKNRKRQNHDEEAYTVEATAHALLWQIYRGASDSAPSDGYTHWLMKKRNAGNYWPSIHATLAAMTSLSQHVLHEDDSDLPLDIEIDHLDENNATLTDVPPFDGHVFKLSAAAKTMRYITKGRGSTWIKIDSSYYSANSGRSRTVKSRTIRSLSSTFCTYDFNIEMAESFSPFSTPGGRSSVPSRLVWEVNIDVDIEDAEDTAYRSYVVDISLPAGSKVVETDLRKLFNPVEHILDHYRLTSRSVVLYMTGKKSVSFRVTSAFAKGDPLPAIIYPVSDPEMACTKFFNFNGLPNTIQTFCSEEGNSVERVCVCAGGKSCPAFKKPKNSARITVQERTSQTCSQKSTFAYKIYPKWEKVIDSVWMEYFAHVSTVFRSDMEIEAGSNVEHSFWIKRNCNKISTRRDYLVIGTTVHEKEDGSYKHLLDKDGWVELWPNEPSNCATARSSNACKAHSKLEEYAYKMGLNSCGSA